MSRASIRNLVSYRWSNPEIEMEGAGTGHKVSEMTGMVAATEATKVGELTQSCQQKQTQCYKYTPG